MRIESSVTAISWIPSDAIEGMPKLPFELGVAKYDVPPPDSLEEGDLERLRAEDRFREANRLAAWIEVEGGGLDDPSFFLADLHDLGGGAARLVDSIDRVGPAVEDVVRAVACLLETDRLREKASDMRGQAAGSLQNFDTRRAGRREGEGE